MVMLPAKVISEMIQSEAGTNTNKYIFRLKTDIHNSYNEPGFMFQDIGE